MCYIHHSTQHTHTCVCLCVCDVLTGRGGGVLDVASAMATTVVFVEGGAAVRRAVV